MQSLTAYFYSEVWWPNDLTEKEWSKSANFRMVDCVQSLRNLLLGEIESISRILVGPSQMFDVQEALEKIFDQI